MLADARLWVALVVGGALLHGHAVSAQQAQTHTVEITGFKFMPEVARVRVGDTIVIINKDGVPHTATQAPTGWDSGTLAQDKSWSLKVEAAGSFDYFCRFHPSMKAKLVVE